MPLAAFRERVARVGRSAVDPSALGWLTLELGLFVLLWLSPFCLRSALLFEQSLPFTATDANGYVSDAAVAAVTAILLTVVSSRLGRKARMWVLALVSVPWTLIHVGNYEHIKAIGAPLQFTYAQYMRDGVFVAGSAFSLSRVALVVTLLVVGLSLSLWLGRRAVSRWSWQARSIAVLSLALLNAVWPTDTRALAWRRDHFIELVLRPAASNASAAAHAALPPSFRSNLHPDLDGTMRVPPRRGRPNVLLVILEGISGGNIPSLAEAHGVKADPDMPELSGLADRYVAFPTFFTNQRQTNRGEFALLCGRLDYLVSGTSKMTEYARDGGETCLPQVLGDAGYRTMYVQSAPLSFMLKDQFMVKAGFTDVRGHDFFTNAYARTSWGVDDKAFFEQATTAISELNAGSMPWFAALLTVGTHHPYTVPESYRTGDAADQIPRARAIRYLDEAIGAFVAGLEDAKLLDNTLLLITSDESFGVEGYDDLTKLLSYNWGFMIAKVPGEAHRVIGQPFAQTDVALTIADYLGINASFVGRSLFRDYQRPRRLVFANTYQHKVYWAEPPQIVECDEELSNCQKHTSLGLGLFGDKRSSAAAEDGEIAPLREMIAMTSTRASRRSEGRTPLILDNAAVWEVGPDSKGLVFGGQYFTLEADQEVVVSLEASVAGPGAAVQLDSDLYARGALYEMLPPPLYDGDTVHLEFVYAPAKVQNNIEVRLKARALNGKTSRLVLEKAEMVARARTLKHTGGATSLIKVDRAEPMQTYFLGSGISPQPSKRKFRKDACVKQRKRMQYLAKGCPRTNLLFGPYVKIPAQSRVRATFEVEAEKGKTKLRGDIVSAKGKTEHAESEVVTLQGDGRATIVVTYQAREAAVDLEARLSLIEGDDNATLVIRRAVLEVFPPENRQK